MFRKTAASILTILTLAGAGVGLLAPGASPIFAAPYRSGKPAIEQMAPAGLYAEAPKLLRS